MKSQLIFEIIFITAIAALAIALYVFADYACAGDCKWITILTPDGRVAWCQICDGYINCF